LVLIIAITVLVYVRDKHDAPDTAANTTQSINTFSRSPTKKDIEDARIHQTVIGIIGDINETQLMVSSKGKAVQTFKITSNTKYSYGPEYLDGKRLDVKIGQSVSVTYNPDNNEIWTIWYAF
jgi:hypothetical protein